MTDSTSSFPEDSSNFYSFGARRIGRYLAKLGMPIPDEDAVRKELLNRFEGVDYLAAKRLLEKEDSADWHTVVAGEVDSDLSGFSVQAARTFVDGLAAVLGICDRERIFPSAIDRLPDGIRLRVHDKTFAEIRRMYFEPYQPRHRERVHSALKGIRTRGENERMVARLRSLPGFASINFELDQDSRTEPYGFLLVPFPANWATAMMSAMVSLGLPVKRHVAQELVAQLFGASNWQHLVANDGEARVWATPFAVAKSETDTTSWRYYRTVGESVWAFGKTLESWNGKPLLIDSCRSATLSDGLYVATALVENPRDHDREGLPFCTPVDIIEPGDSNDCYPLARQAAALLDAGGDPMAALGWSGDFSRNILAANVRLGSTGERTLQLGAWWLRVFDAHQRAYLSLEQFDADGTRMKADSIPLYKTTLRHDAENNILTVLGDYDREDVATIPNVSTEQIEQLRLMVSEPADNPSAPAYWGQGDIRGEWPPLPN